MSYTTEQPSSFDFEDCCICGEEFSTDVELAEHLIEHAEENEQSEDAGRKDVIKLTPLALPEFSTTSLTLKDKLSNPLNAILCKPPRTILPTASRSKSPEVVVLSDDSDDEVKLNPVQQKSLSPPLTKVPQRVTPVVRRGAPSKVPRHSAPRPSNSVQNLIHKMATLSTVDNEFVEEIQQMMYGLGDCKKPLHESARLIQQILHQQLNSLLIQLSNVPTPFRRACICYEDVLFLMRRDKLKLARLVKYLELRDKGEEYAKITDFEEVGPPKQILTRSEKCYKFLKKIDQTGEILTYLNSGQVDEVKLERAHRLDAITTYMSAEEYENFCLARRTSFRTNRNYCRFKVWLLKDRVTRLSLSDFAMEMLSYLAFEIVAEIVELSFLVKKDYERIFTNENVSILNGSKLPPVCIPKNDTSPFFGQSCITPEHIREVVRRYFRPGGPFASFSGVYRVPIENRLFCC